MEEHTQSAAEMVRHLNQADLDDIGQYAQVGTVLGYVL